MGNQQSSVSEGLQFCSTRSHPLAKSLMVDKNFRIDYVSSKRYSEEDQFSFAKAQPFTHQRIKSNPSNNRQSQVKCERHVHQQRARDENRQQQKQEELEHRIVSLDHSKFQKGPPEVVVQQERGTVYEGIFGRIVLNNKCVCYRDGTGNEFNEEYDRKKLRKTFPMGISYGGLSQSLWFKDIEERDACFGIMTKDFPPCTAAMSNPSHHSVPNMKYKEAKDVKEFDGLQGDVFVHQDGCVVYTDLNGEQHFVNYANDKIQKCFPNGICFGGLPKAIWLKDNTERDQCYKQMQLVGQSVEEEEKTVEKTFPGLYGNVTLRSFSEVKFTSLAGAQVTAVRYDTKMIRRVFPMGISGGGLPSTIWFREMEDREDCINAMMELN